MRRYEQIYILRPSLSENEITTVIENTNQIVLNDHGTIIHLGKWGMRKLAYPIKKETQGYYVFCDFVATPQAVAEIERKFRIDDAVLKYLSVKISDSISAEEISAAQEAAAAKVSSAGQDDESENTEPSTADDADDNLDSDDEDKE
jgi:small subunit ribosomal protein S6